MIVLPDQSQWIPAVYIQRLSSLIIDKIHVLRQLTYLCSPGPLHWQSLALVKPTCMERGYF